MAFVRRRFVAAIVVDAVFVCFVLVAGLVHALARGHEDSVAPFLGHAGHALIGVLGLAGVCVPVASAPSRALTVAAPLAAVGDVLAFGAHAQLARGGAALNEYVVFASLAIALAASAANVYGAARAELATFGTLVHGDSREHVA